MLGLDLCIKATLAASSHDAWTQGTHFAAALLDYDALSVAVGGRQQLFTIGSDRPARRRPVPGAADRAGLPVTHEDRTLSMIRYPCSRAPSAHWKKRRVRAGSDRAGSGIPTVVASGNNQPTCPNLEYRGEGIERWASSPVTCSFRDLKVARELMESLTRDLTLTSQVVADPSAGGYRGGASGGQRCRGEIHLINHSHTGGVPRRPARRPAS